MPDIGEPREFPRVDGTALLVDVDKDLDKRLQDYLDPTKQEPDPVQRAPSPFFALFAVLAFGGGIAGTSLFYGPQLRAVAELKEAGYLNPVGFYGMTTSDGSPFQIIGKNEIMVHGWAHSPIQRVEVFWEEDDPEPQTLYSVTEQPPKESRTEFRKSHKFTLNSKRIRPRIVVTPFAGTNKEILDAVNQRLDDLEDEFLLSPLGIVWARMSEPERVLAELVLRQGGDLQLTASDYSKIPVKSEADLPDGPISIYEVNLGGRRMSEDLLYSFDDVHLASLVLTGAGVSDTVALHLNSGLEFLYLNDNARIGDATLDRIAELTKLQRLELSQTNVSDQGIRKLSRLSSLKGLTLRGTDVTDEALETLGELKELVYLDLRGTGVTEEGISDLRLDLPECKIEL